MDKEFVVNSIRTASEEVFSMMLGLKVEYGPAYDQQRTTVDTESVLGLVGIAGSWIGTGAISCSPAFACQMSSLLLMAEYDHVHSDVLDAVAEIANMIFGNVKTALEEQVGRLGLSIPTVIFGKNFQTKHTASRIWTGIPLYAEGMEMQITLGLTPRHGTTSSSAVGIDQKILPVAPMRAPQINANARCSCQREDLHVSG
jgi:chemotaxis protein CheX